MTGLRPLEELREGLRTAATREIAAEDRAPRRRRRWSGRRPLLAVAAGVLLAGGAATAAELIATGDPQPDAVTRDAALRPSGEVLPVDVTARDEPLSWGVTTYRSAAGDRCSIAGQLRAGRLGVVRDGTFRPYAEGTGGPCYDPGRLNYATDVRRFTGRTIVFGRASRRVRSVVVRQAGEPDARARTGRAGAFLFVFAADFDVARFSVTALDAAGRPVPLSAG
jgi:hypothetical protein